MKSLVKSSKTILLSVFAILFVAASVFLLSACGEKTTPSVEAKVLSYYFDESTLPTISVVTDVDGDIVWDDNQTVEAGVKSYNWTFTPKNTDAYEVVKGSIELKNVDKYVSGQQGQTYESEIALWEDGKTYVYENCNFASSVSSTKKVDLTFINCTFNTSNTGAGGDKCIYLTSFTNLVVEGCTFGGETTEGTLSTAGYALDLNIYSTEVDKIVIKNNKFNTTAGANADSVAISIKVRLGETDKPTDVTGTEGSILNGVEISGNDFADTCNTIYIGSGPKGSANANISTGAFNVSVSGNTTDVYVLERYLYPEGETAPRQLVGANSTASFGNKTSIE